MTSPGSPEQASAFRARAGTTGPAGPRGPPGPPGPPGEDGFHGATGHIGRTGPPGPAGEDGIDGTHGRDGRIGPVGPPGRDGVDGMTGSAGPPGEIGPVGSVGAVGPVGPAGTPGKIGGIGPAGHVGPKNESYSSAVARSRDSTFGLILFDWIDKMEPARLKEFDTELLTKCGVWLAGDMSSAAIADVVKIFAAYKIMISHTRANALKYSRAADYRVGFRVSHALTASVQVESPSPNVSLATVYWTTLLDVLCYRGLDRKHLT